MKGVLVLILVLILVLSYKLYHVYGTSISVPGLDLGRASGLEPNADYEKDVTL